MAKKIDISLLEACKEAIEKNLHIGLAAMNYIEPAMKVVKRRKIIAAPKQELRVLCSVDQKIKFVFIDLESNVDFIVCLDSSKKYLGSFYKSELCRVDDYESRNMYFFNLIDGKYSIGKTTHEEFQKRAEATANINYFCNFHEGSCDKYPYARKTGEACKVCCSGCRDAKGYFGNRGERISEEQYHVLVKHWDKKNGFWRPDCGCVLPRKYRSYVCLTHACMAPSAVRGYIGQFIFEGTPIPEPEEKPFKLAIRRGEVYTVDGICPKCKSTYLKNGYAQMYNLASEFNLQHECESCHLVFQTTWKLRARLVSDDQGGEYNI